MSTSVDDETILDVLRSNDAPRMTTTEVAGHLPVTRGTTRTRLQRLVDDDLLERATEGNNVVWWLPEREDELEEWAAAEEEVDAEDGSDEEPSDSGTDAETDSKASGEAEDSDADEEDTEEADAEVTAAEQAKAETEDGPAAVEVEAVGNDEVDVETPDEEAETRTAAGDDAASEDELPELSDDEEGLRALVAVTVGLVVILLIRKLLGGSDGE